MMNFKKYLALFLALVMVFALAACGGEKDPVEDPNNTQTPGQGETNPPQDQDPGKNPNAFGGSVEYKLPDGSATVTASMASDNYLLAATDKFTTLLYTEDPDDVTFVRFDYFVGKEAINVSMDYLDSFIEYNETEAAGTVQIGADGVYAELLTAQNDEQYLESYLVDVEGGSVCIILSVSKDLKDEHLPAMKEILDTLKIA